MKGQLILFIWLLCAAQWKGSIATHSLKCWLFEDRWAMPVFVSCITDSLWGTSVFISFIWKVTGGRSHSSQWSHLNRLGKLKICWAEHPGNLRSDGKMLTHWIVSVVQIFLISRSQIYCIWNQTHEYSTAEKSLKVFVCLFCFFYFLVFFFNGRKQIYRCWT